MKKLFLLTLILIGYFIQANAQTDSVLYHGTFKRRFGMSSNSYKPATWEKPYFDQAIRTAFPSDLAKDPEKYTDKLIQLIGIVDSVYLDNNKNVVFRLDNKYWDYIEDYSIQDEVMFMSDKGDGKFLVSAANISPDMLDQIKKFPEQKKLFMVYGTFKGMRGNLPLLEAQKIRYFDYEIYSTKIYTYSIKRDANGNVVTDKRGKPELTDFHFLTIAKKGQNK